jgi:hypothetical protein
LPFPIDLRRLDCRQTGFSHPPSLNQSLSAPSIDQRPHASGSAGRDADDEAFFIQTVHLAVDPAETERLFDCFRQQDTLAFGVGFLDLQPDLIFLIMVMRQPVMPFLWVSAAEPDSGIFVSGIDNPPYTLACCILLLIRYTRKVSHTDGCFF